MTRTAPSIPDLRGLSPMAKVLRGARYALAGVRLVSLRPFLWGYLAAPLAITLSLFVVGSFVSWQAIGWLMGLVWTPSATSSTLWIAIWLGIVLCMKLVAIGTTGLLLYFTAGLVATPFTDRLSSIVETSVLGPYSEPFTWRQAAGDLWNSLLHSSLSLCLWLTVVVCGFALNLIPVAGSVASFLITGVATAVFLGRESMDGCMSRRRMSYRHKYRVLLSEFWLVFGFGAVAAVLVWIPFLNFLVLPMAVAGGTLMYCHLEQQGLIPDARGNLGYAPTRSRVAALADHGAELDEFPLDPSADRQEALHVRSAPGS